MPHTLVIIIDKDILIMAAIIMLHLNFMVTFQ